jgi:hypothetical protein
MPVVYPDGSRRQPGQKIPLGSTPPIAREGIEAVFSAADARPVVVDEIDAASDGTIEASTRRLAGDEFSANAQRRAGAPPPSQRMLQALREQQAAQQPATAEAINLENLSNEELRRLDDAVTERMSAKGLYGFQFDDSEDDEGGDFDQIEPDTYDVGDAEQYGSIPGSI